MIRIINSCVLNFRNSLKDHIKYKLHSFDTSTKKYAPYVTILVVLKTILQYFPEILKRTFMVIVSIAVRHLILRQKESSKAFASEFLKIVEK